MRHANCLRIHGCLHGRGVFVNLLVHELKRCVQFGAEFSEGLSADSCTLIQIASLFEVKSMIACGRLQVCAGFSACRSMPRTSRSRVAQAFCWPVCSVQVPQVKNARTGRKTATLAAMNVFFGVLPSMHCCAISLAALPLPAQGNPAPHSAWRSVARNDLGSVKRLHAVRDKGACLVRKLARLLSSSNSTPKQEICRKVCVGLAYLDAVRKKEIFCGSGDPKPSFLRIYGGRSYFLSRNLKRKSCEYFSSFCLLLYLACWRMPNATWWK